MKTMEVELVRSQSVKLKINVPTTWTPAQVRAAFFAPPACVVADSLNAIDWTTDRSPTYAITSVYALGMLDNTPNYTFGGETP